VGQNLNLLIQSIYEFLDLTKREEGGIKAGGASNKRRRTRLEVRDRITFVSNMVLLLAMESDMSHLDGCPLGRIRDPWKVFDDLNLSESS
jgi:hypothetical protein